MQAWQIADAQKAFIIRQGEDGSPVAEPCREGPPSSIKTGNGETFCSFRFCAE